MKSKIATFTKNHTTVSNGKRATHGPSPPPRKSRVRMEHTVIMLTYSATKNVPNRRLEYSVWKPATNSVSASGKSKGARLVSASAVTPYITNGISSGMTYQRWCADCAATMPPKPVVPASMTTGTIESPIASSWEMICAVEGVEPSSGDFDCDAQPPSAMP